MPEGDLWGVESSNDGLDDAGLAALASLVRREGIPGLSLENNTRITDRGLEALKGIGTLRWLHMGCNDGISSDGLSVLRTLPGLVEFSACCCPPVAAHLGSLARLEFLRAGCSWTEPPGFEALSACPGLRFLDVGDSEVRDEDLARMPPLPRLEEIRWMRSGSIPAGLESLERHGSLRCISADGMPLDARSLRSLARLPRLEHIHDFAPPSDAADLEALAGLGGLRIADFREKPGPREIGALARLRRLELLDLDGADVRDEDLRPLAGLRELKCLILRNTWVTDAGLVHLRDMDRLEVLDLSLTRITDAGLSCLAGMPALRWLGLDLCREVTGRGLSHLPADSPLAHLSATQSGFDEEGLAEVARLPALRDVNLHRSRVPEARLRAFHAGRGEPTPF